MPSDMSFIMSLGGYAPNSIMMTTVDSFTLAYALLNPFIMNLSIQAQLLQVIYLQVLLIISVLDVDETYNGLERLPWVLHIINLLLSS